MQRRRLVALLYWLDRVPVCFARWEAERLVLDELEELEAERSDGSGVFRAASEE